MNDAQLFINAINDNYEEIKQELTNYCDSVSKTFDEDIFQDTILKCYLLIEKQGEMKDPSYQGIKNYLFMSFKINMNREKQYARNAKKDGNIVDIGKVYESYSNNNKFTQKEKLLNDLYTDYATLYLMHKVEQNFDGEHFYLFRLKTFDKNMTYQRLAEKTGIKSVRQKVVDVKNYLKANVTKEEIKKAFEEDYGDFLL